MARAIASISLTEWHGADFLVAVASYLTVKYVNDAGLGGNALTIGAYYVGSTVA